LLCFRFLFLDQRFSCFLCHLFLIPFVILFFPSSFTFFQMSVKINVVTFDGLELKVGSSYSVHSGDEMEEAMYLEELIPDGDQITAIMRLWDVSSTRWEKRGGHDLNQTQLASSSQTPDELFPSVPYLPLLMLSMPWITARF